MEPSERHVVVTGAAGGIGRALVRRFAAEGARAIVAADRDIDGARAIAREVGGLAIELDAGSEQSVQAMLASAREAHGPVDIQISNAGVPGGMGGPETGDELWDEAWRVNVMAHVWAARVLVPEMRARGGLFDQHRLGGRTADAGLLARLQRDQARGRGAR